MNINFAVLYGQDCKVRSAVLNHSKPYIKKDHYDNFVAPILAQYGKDALDCDANVIDFTPSKPLQCVITFANTKYSFGHNAQTTSDVLAAKMAVKFKDMLFIIIKYEGLHYTCEAVLKNVRGDSSIGASIEAEFSIRTISVYPIILGLSDSKPPRKTQSLGDYIAGKDSPCSNGLVFKCNISQYFDKRGNYCKTVRMNKAQRLSCKCEKCLTLEASFHESFGYDVFPILDENSLVHGAYYSIRTTNIHTDWESGIVDDYDFEYYYIQDQQSLLH